MWRAALLLREWLTRLRNSLRPHRSDADLEAELQSHLELAQEAASADSARDEVRRARLRAGGVHQATEAMRDQRGLRWLEDFGRDLRYAGRMMAKQPGFTAIAAASLALGVGANTAAFSWADALLLRPLPIPRPADLLTVGFQASHATGSLSMSYREFLDVREHATSFSGLTAFAGLEGAMANDVAAVPQPSVGVLVSDGFFDVLGLSLSLGRDFRSDEHEVLGRDAVVILSHDAWTQRFAAAPTVLGRTVVVNGTPLTVIGVAPPGFHGLDLFLRNEFYMPLAMWPRLRSTVPKDVFETRVQRWVSVRGRLSRGVSLEQAQAELTGIASDLERAYPDTNKDTRLVARTELRQRLAEEVGNVTLSALLLALAVLVAATACANVAGLLVSRAPVRAQEVSLRQAVGASQGRILRQLLTEGLAIAALGCGGGLLVAYGALAVFRWFRVPSDLPITVNFALDRRALAVAAGAAFLTAAVSSLMPAIRTSRTSLTATMKRGPATSHGRHRPLGAWLAGAQVTCAVVLLTVAAFLVQDLGGRLAAGPGFQHAGRLMMWFDPDAVGTTADEARRFFDAVTDGARALPGVKSATLTSFVPMDGGERGIRIFPEGFDFGAGPSGANPWSASVDESYFQTLGVRVLEGRAFASTDRDDAAAVAVVNTTVAANYWPGQSAVGKRFRIDDESGPWVDVVGVAATDRYSFLIEPPREFVYLSRRQRPPRTMALIVEADQPEMLAASVRELVRRIDGRQPIFTLRTLSEQYRMRVVVVFEILMTLVMGTAAMGVGLALVGLYGLVAYGVSRRTKEIGIRRAVGASTTDVLRLAIRQGVVVTLVGLAVGLPTGIVAAKLIAATLPGGLGRTTTDVLAFTGLVVATLSIALLAAYVPARRALAVAPVQALRAE